MHREGAHGSRDARRRGERGVVQRPVQVDHRNAEAGVGLQVQLRHIEAGYCQHAGPWLDFMKEDIAAINAMPVLAAFIAIS